MKMLKQTLSMLLVLCMVLGMVPFSAFAATTIAEKPKGGSTTAQPFPSNTGGSQYFRIPALVTTGSGRVVAGIDARWNGTGDACGIDTMTSYSDDGGNNWNYTFANYLGDNNLQYIKNAATFIDPAIAVDGNTLYMLVDLYAANYAINTADYSPLTGNPFTDDGYLKLKASGAQTYDYYLKDGKIYDLNNTAVKHYTVDEYFNLNNNNKQESNLFYAEAAYQAYPTTHLYLTKSTDGGTTWGTPTLLKVKEDSEYFYGICPGRGLVTSDGTIMFACYVYGGNASTQRASVIYSTDNGATWNRSGNITTDIWSSETQLVELKDGTICAFFRNGQGNICYAQATGNATSGYTWGNYVNTGVSNHSDCMLSAIKLSKTHNGQEVILVSCPTNTGSRANGKFTTFLVGENNTLTRANQYEINGSGQHFAYSCMTELSAAKEDGAYKVGILYENANAAVTYAEYDIETITGLDFDVHVTDSTGAITATVVKLGRTQTYTIQNLAGVTASAVSDNEGVVTASVADGVLSLTGVANGTATVTVTAGQAQVTLAVTVDAKEQEIDLAVGQQQTITVDSTITAGNHSSTAADVSWIPASENFPSAQTLSNSTYGTTTIKLDECLYTLTKDANNQYYLTADADDTTVYVSPHAGAGDAGYPNRTNATQNVVFANSTYTNGAITLSDSSGSLHFHSETGNNHLMWNQCNSVCGVNHDMFIYAVGDTTSNTVLGGYYTQITDVANLTPNQKYLILAKDANGTYYALYPSLSKATRYDQIAKVTNTFSGYATGDTAITITAKAVGETSVEIGDITYKIKVNAAEATEPDAANVVDVNLYVGENKTIEIQKVITSGTHESNAADVEWAAAEVEALTYKAIQGTDTGFNGTQVEFSACLYTFKYSAANRYVISAKTSANQTVYVNPYYTLGSPNRTTRTVVEVQEGLSSEQVKLYGNSGSLHFHPEAPTPYWNRCGNDTTSGCNVLMLYRPVKAGETSSTEIPGYVKIAGRDALAEEVGTGSGQYLIVGKNDEGNYYLLYPTTATSTATQKRTQMAKVSGIPTSVAGTAITVTANDEGTTSVIIDDTKYNITVSYREASVAAYIGTAVSVTPSGTITQADIDAFNTAHSGKVSVALTDGKLVFTGIAEGPEFTAILGNTRYRITTAKVVENITLRPGLTRTFTIDGFNYGTGDVKEPLPNSDSALLENISGTAAGSAREAVKVTKIESGKQYIFVNSRAAKTLTNTATGNRLTLAGTKESLGANAIWNVESTDGGYFVTDAKGNYLTVGNGTAQAGTTAHTIALNFNGAAWTIGEASYYLNDYNNQGNQVSGYNNSTDAGSLWQIYEVVPVGASTEVTFKGVTAGTTTTAVVGHVTYNIKVLAQEVRDITLYVGVTQNDFIDGYTYDATNIKQPDNTYAYIHSATAENDGTKVVFSGVAEGTTDTATVGHVKYNITVKSLRSGGDIPDFNCVVAEKSYSSANTSTNLAGKKVNSLRITAGAKFDLGVDVTGYDSIAWTTADPAVATVDTTGQVTAVAEGTTLVTATVIKNGITESIAVHVTVVPSLVEGCNADQISTVVFHHEEVYKTDPFYTLFLSSENETGPVAGHTMVLVMEGEVIYLERPKAAAYAMVWTADPWNQHALTAMSAANTLGNYFPLQSERGVVGENVDEGAGIDGEDIVYFKCTSSNHNGQKNCPYHNVVNAGISAGGSWQAALDELLRYNAHIGEGIWTEYGCDGVMITSRSYNDNGPNVATSQVFISDKLPEVTKVVDGVLPVTRKYDYYRRYDPTTSPVVVATIGEQVYFKITVTLERPHAMQTGTSVGANIYDDASLQDVMKNIFGDPVGKEIGFFYTKELDTANGGKWDGIIADDAKTQQEIITEWLNAPWGDNEEKRVKEMYFLYTIQPSDLDRSTLGNEINLNYSYSSKYSTGISTGGAVANASVLITGKMLDPAVIDFGESIRGEIFADQLGNAVRGEAHYGTVDIRGNLLTYTPNAILQNMDTVTLYDASGKLINSLIVYPATTVYYEEDFLVKENSGWTLGGTNTIVGSNGFQTLEKLGAALYDTSGQYIETITDKKYPYGYDPMYQAIGASGGTYAATTAVGATTSFTFTGTGFDLYANCKLNTGYVAVTLKDAAGKAVKMYTVNTVLKDAQSETEEYNLPIVSELALPHGTYTVEVRKIVNDGKEVRLDGVRIYNTLEDTSYFTVDLEADPLFFELRDYVLKALNIGYSEQYDTATGIANQVYGLLNGDSASDEKPTEVSAVVLDTAKRTSRDIQATKVNIEYHDGGRCEQIIVQGIYKEYDAVGNTVVKETVEDICDLAKFMTKDGQITAEPNRSGVKNRTETPIICDKVEVTTTTTTYADGGTSEETVVDAITGAQTTEIFKIIVNRYGNDIVALEANASEVVNRESEKTVFESKQSTTTAQELLDNGPKNELFLYPGQSLTFNVNTSRMLQLGLKAPLAATNYSLQYVVDGNTTVVADNQALNSSVDMFYNLQNLPKVNIATADKVTITSTSANENKSQTYGAAALVDGNKSTLYKFHDAQLDDEESIIMTYDAARIMDTMVITFEKVNAPDTLNYAYTYSIRAYNADDTYDIIADRVTANRTSNNSQTYTFTAKAYSKVEIVMHSCTRTSDEGTVGHPAVAEFEIYGTERTPLVAPVTHTVTVENNGPSILSVTKLKISDDPNGNLVPLTVADIRQALLASGYPADEEEETPDADPTVPMETQPVETQPVETQPVETQPVETQPVETKPAVTEPENAFGCTKDIDCVLSQFTDADANEWYHDGVHFCVAEGLMNGMGEGIFAPNDPTTRAQLVTMLYRLMGSPKAEGKTEPFTDVAEGEWYYDAIVWAYSENVVKGISETEFAPNANVTREQVATILHRFLATPEGTGKLDSFSDAASVSDYAEDALVWAVGEGLINGVAQTDGKVLLDPTGTATRAQIATILYRYLENA